MTNSDPNALDDDTRVNSHGPQSDGLFDVRLLLEGLWRGKWVILLCALIGLGLGLKKLRGFNPTYEATMVVVSSSGGAAPPQMSGVSRVAQSLGVALPTGRNSSGLFDRLIVTLGSVQLAQQLNDEHDIIRKIFFRSWNSETASWKIPTGWRFDLEQKFNRALHLPTWREPSVESLASFLGSAIKFKEFEDMAFYQIKYANEDPKLARWVLEMAIFEADKILRQKDQGESEFRKNYLQRQMAKTSVNEHQTMFMSMIANEERRSMLLQSDRPYSLDVIRPVFVSDVPTSPDLIENFAIILVGWILGGVAVIMLVTLVREV
jgi:LPS O-antigen subunit length determinant protein (WzzB/FepE family)